MNTPTILTVEPHYDPVTDSWWGEIKEYPEVAAVGKSQVDLYRNLEETMLEMLLNEKEVAKKFFQHIQVVSSQDRNEKEHAV